MDNFCYPIPDIQIEPLLLMADLKNMEDELWKSGYRYTTPSNDWEGIALYSVSGKTDDLRSADRPTRQTEAGKRCDYICNKLLPQFLAPPLRVGFYRLRLGTCIGRHRDVGHNRWTTGFVRIHIPVVTNPGVVMYVSDKPYVMPVGTAWYFDATTYHKVENTGSNDRIHLIADFKLTKGLNSLLRPLTWSDRRRLALDAGASIISQFQRLNKFARTPEGRARIVERVKVLLHMS